MTYPIVQVPDEAGDAIEQLGTKLKFWFHGRQRLYKQGRAGTGENWAEKVACEICTLLGLPHAHYELAVWRGQQGVVTDAFHGQDARLVHGNELLSRIHPDYADRCRYERRQHTVGAFLGIGKDSRIEPPEGYALPRPLTVAADLMVGYLMLDCLIGNQDRHDENWGLIVRPGRPRRLALAPTYDHASSLGRNETDERRAFRLSTRDHGAGIDAYCARARSAFYEGSDPGASASSKPLGTFAAFAAAAGLRRAAAAFWLDRLTSLGASDFEAIFAEVPAALISTQACEFALRMLEVNRARLLTYIAMQRP